RAQPHRGRPPKLTDEDIEAAKALLANPDIAVTRCLARDALSAHSSRNARVSTVDQNLALQRDALAEAGCQKIFTEQISGEITDRPMLNEALAFARSADTLIVWKRDRLARSMKQLIETIEELRLRGIGFRR